VDVPARGANGRTDCRRRSAARVQGRGRWPGGGGARRLRRGWIARGRDGSRRKQTLAPDRGGWWIGGAPPL